MPDRLIVSLMALSIAGFAGGAVAQTASPRQPAVTSAQPNASTTDQRQRRRQRPADAQAQQWPPRQPARPAGGLNLDLRSRDTTTNRAPRGPGDTFTASGPYATDAQMQRYTGQRQGDAPRAGPRFSTGEIDRTTGFPSGTLPGVQPVR